jgi:antitoxin MazE
MVEDKKNKLDYNRKFKYTREDGKTNETYIGAIHNCEPFLRYIWCWNIKNYTYKTDLSEDEVNLLFATYCDVQKLDATTNYAIIGYRVCHSVYGLNERDREFVLNFLLKPKSNDIEKIKNIVDLAKCPVCDSPLKKETKEVKPGIYANVMVCSKCEESHRKQHERNHKAYYSKAFMRGKNLALGIPKKLADKAGLKEGIEYEVNEEDGKIIIVLSPRF